MKRGPVYLQGNLGRYAKLSKADWADVFADLYLQVFGEKSPADVIMLDAEKRIENLKLQGVR